MNWWQRFLGWLNFPQTDGQLGGRATPIHSATHVAVRATSPQPLPAGRASLDSAANLVYSSNWVMQPPTEPDTFWRLHNLDVAHLDVMSPKELLDMLVDLSEDVGYAVWQFQRLCNPGYEYKVYRLGSDKREHVAGRAHVDQLISRLRDLYGSFDVVLGRFFMGAYLRGGFCGELVLDAAARESVDLVSPDPYSVRFRQVNDPIRGKVWQPGQMQGGKFVPLDIPTFRYIPVDPAPASPYGRALASPSLFLAIFSLGLLHDVKRVIMQQGYKRMDITLNTEQAMDSFSFDPQGYDTLGDYVRAAMAEVKRIYRSLEPDDAFLHTDIFELGSPVGTIDSDSIGAIDKIMERLEKKITRALKSNGVVMDTGENLNQTDSNRKWEIHAAGIKSLQHHCEAMLESLLDLSLQAKGIQAFVQFRFAELRAAEMFRDEQTKAMQIQNARNLYEAGYTSQDESSLYAIGHNADQPEPRKPIVQLDFQEDNNSGNEDFSKPEEETNRDLKLNVAILEKPATVNHRNGAR